MGIRLGMARLATVFHTSRSGWVIVQVEIRGAERLSFRERQVVALKEMGMGNAQVAKRLGVSAGTVATLFNRAKKKGYQVVIVLSGDPLALFVPDEDEDDGDDGGGDPEAG